MENSIQKGSTFLGSAMRWIRKVVRPMVFGGNTFNQNHFYGYDAWKVFSDEVKDFIPEGFTLYGEAVGFLKEGGAIQSMKGKPYAYGCEPGTHKLVIYRITFTNPNGDCFDLTWPQIKEFCVKYGLEHVHEFYYGKAKDLYPELDSSDPVLWRDQFLQKMTEDETIGMGDADCLWNPGLPSEGVVVKKDTLFGDTVWKNKNFRFLEGETETLDKGETNIEDNQTSE